MCDHVDTVWERVRSPSSTSPRLDSLNLLRNIAKCIRVGTRYSSTMLFASHIFATTCLTILRTCSPMSYIVECSVAKLKLVNSMVSDFFFPQPGGVESHIYQLSTVRSLCLCHERVLIPSRNSSTVATKSSSLLMHIKVELA